MSGEMIMSILLSALIIVTGILFKIKMKKDFAEYTRQNPTNTNSRNIGV